MDSVAADCELVGRMLSRDPYATADAQHETEVEPGSFTVGRTTVAVFQVGRIEDGAASNIGYAVTRNDSASWRSGFMPGLTTASRPAGTNVRASTRQSRTTPHTERGSPPPSPSATA